MPKKAPKPNKMQGQSKQPLENLVNCLKIHAPQVFTEDKVDPKLLQKSLGNLVDSNEERYGLNWAGKTDCFREIQQTTGKTLKPNRKESVNFDETGNIFIEGENLQVLKILQGSYYGKIKMIYIDPPYNTGNDFIYDDNFAQTKKEYLQKAGAIDKDGNILEDGLYHRNTRDSGHFHSNWLNMMYPRLYLARNLLRDDGVIFVSIDDNEVHNLRLIMNEIFGEENFIADIIWQKRYGRNNDAKLISNTAEHIIFYRKTELLSLIREKRKEENNAHYSNPDKDPRGPWTSVSYIGQRTKEERKNLSYKITRPIDGKIITHPVNAWKFSQDKYITHVNEKRLYWGSDGRASYPRLKRFLSETSEAGIVPVNLWEFREVGSGDEAVREVKDLLGKQIFDYPKPTKLIEKMLGIVNETNAYFLDFFTGSGTTAHAVMQLNAEDGGNRKCISVQLPEACGKDSEAYKAGYKTIADIAKERIRRAAKKIKKENKDAKFDDGFKVFKLDDSNFKIWNTQIESQEQLEQQLLDFVDNVQKGAADENILYELLVKSGQELNVNIEEKKVDKHVYYRIGDGSIIVCLDKITDKLLEAVLADKPKKLIVLERAFGGKDELMTNTVLRAKNAGVDDVLLV